MERLSRPSRRRLPRTLAVAALGAAALLAPLAVAAPAAAHSSIVATTPETDGTEPQLPAEVSVTFSDDLTPPLPSEQQQGGESNTQIRVYDATCEDAALEIANPGTGDTRDCRDYATGDAVVDGPTVTQAIDTTDAPAGAYTVIWQVVYGDGHADSSMFTFTAEEAAAPAATEAPTATPSESASPATPDPADTEAATTAPDDAGSGIGAPAVIAIVGGVLVLAIIVVIIVMIARSRRV